MAGRQLVRFSNRASPQWGWADPTWPNPGSMTRASRLRPRGSAAAHRRPTAGRRSTCTRDTKATCRRQSAAWGKVPTAIRRDGWRRWKELPKF